MKNIQYFGIILFTLLLMSPTNVWAQKDPSRVTMFNSFTDFFATIGKSADEKKKEVQKRRQYRREARMFKQRQKAKKKTMKTMSKQNQAILDKIKTRKYPSGRRDKE